MHGPIGQPGVRNPISCIRTWLRFTDETEILPEAFQHGWASRYAELNTLKEAGQHVLPIVTSSMIATILHLMQLYIRPCSPMVLYRHQQEDDRATLALPWTCGAPPTEKSTLGGSRTASWSDVSSREANRGLYQREPGFGPTKRIHERMLGDG